MSTNDPTSLPPDSPPPDSPPPDSPASDGAVVYWGAVLRGALVGVCVLVAASVIQAVLDQNMDNFKDSGWIYPLFVLVLVGYGVGGYTAGRATPQAPLTNGTLAGLFAFAMWIPVRILIWVARDENKGLFTGHSPAIRPGQILGQLVIAAGLGMLGGVLGGKAAARAQRAS